MALRERAGIRGCGVLLYLTASSGCATRPAPAAAAPPLAAAQPAPLVFGPTPDEQLRQLHTRVDVLTDRLNDIYLRQVQMEQRLEELAKALEQVLPPEPEDQE